MTLITQFRRVNIPPFLYTVVQYLLCVQMTLGCCLSGQAQQVPVSIREAIVSVEQNLPRLEAARQQTKAIRQNENLAKNTLVPDFTVGYQAGYATYNNITGMSYPGLVLPISGPPSSRNNYELIPGTALAGLFRWNPLTFGQRSAAQGKAAAEYQVASASYADQVFREQSEAIVTYMNILYLQKALTSLDSNIVRSRTALFQSLILAKAGLRPGIDTTQFQSDLAQADIERIQTQKIYETQLVELTRQTGIRAPAGMIYLSDTAFLSREPAGPDSAEATQNNLVYQLYASKKNLSMASLQEINKAWTPRLDVWANAYARGSGVNYAGEVNKAEGWSLSRSNYGLGIQLSFPILAYWQVNIQKKKFGYQLHSDEAQLSQVSLDISKQLESARISLRQNKRVEEKIRVQLHAASEAYRGLQISYEAGLTDYTRLVQGQYELLQAELSQAGARIQSWRALLDIAVASGNLNILLDQLK